MKVILLCGAYLNKAKVLLHSKGFIDNAANNFSMKLIDGFKTIDNIDFTCINASFIGSYPVYYRQLYYNGIGEVDNIIDVDFLNIFAIRNISRYMNITKAMKDQIGKNTQSEIAVIAYSLHAPFIFALRFAKRIRQNIRTCVIVPDLPEMMNLQKKLNPIKRLLKRVDSRLIYRNLKFVDNYVLLTKHMKDYLSLKDKPYEIIEGVVSESELSQYLIAQKSLPEKKAFLYAGTLNYVYGIMDLVDAFMKIDNNELELWICGNGEAKSQINEAAYKNKRIIYYGNLDSNDLKKLYNKAYALINPRPPVGEYTLYSFPSKIMEYLSTGVPTICYFLPGMPDEYKRFIFEIRELGIDGIYDSLKRFLNTEYDELLHIAKDAQNFLLQNKTEKRQVERIINLIWGRDGKQ